VVSRQLSADLPRAEAAGLSGSGRSPQHAPNRAASAWNQFKAFCRHRKTVVSLTTRRVAEFAMFNTKQGCVYPTVAALVGALCGRAAAAGDPGLRQEYLVRQALKAAARVAPSETVQAMPWSRP
jgi:hypothetical protein